MVHLPPLIQDLGIILVTAALVSLIFKSLKQPVVLGYLIAGVLVGPHFSFMPTVVDTESLKVWAEIGVIFLLFSLGLEFSFKKLTQVGVSASITGVFEILFMLFIGFYTGRFLGWTNMDSLFLGGILSISSTTIIVRAFDELGLKGKKFVTLVFGVLIVEDLMAILLLVLLSTVAVTRAFSGIELMFSTVKLMFFLIMWFVLGIYTLPILLRSTKKFLNDETMLIVSLGLCLFMVIVATQTGFSPALGAFVMGSLLAETRKGKAIELVIGPVKNLFAAIFFVSVGMLINPLIIYQYWGVILFLTTVIVFGKIIGVTTGALLSGQSAKISLQTGMSLAQIGEFSFIIATLGLTLGVTNDRLYPIAVAVSALTTFTTPYLIKYSSPFYFWLEKHAPDEVKNALLKYQTDMAAGPNPSMIGVLWNNYGKKILLNGVIIVALTLAAKNYVLPVLSFRFVNVEWLKPVVAMATLFIASPFLWALTVSKAPPPQTHEIVILKTMRLVELVVATIRLLLGVFFISFIAGSFISLQAASLFIFIGVSAIGIFLMKYSEPYYKKIETRFLSHLDDKEKNLLSKKRQMPILAPWSATFAEYVLSADSDFVGKTLIDCAIKEKFGVTVALIERGAKKIIAPGRAELLMPSDRLFLIGTDEQLEIIKPLIELIPPPSNTEELEIYGLGSFVITADSVFHGKSIRECGLRERVQGLIVGLERNEERMLNPDSAIILESGDLVWIVGDRLKIKSLA
jgi:CPA2 family monovalent cation:H+ antiporter-2